MLDFIIDVLAGFALFELLYGDDDDDDDEDDD